MLPSTAGDASVAEVAAAARDSEDALAPHQGDRGVVRARLRARLIERCTTELVSSLEERYGRNWAREVVEEGFLVHQSMLRICESFGLRPHMESQVLWAVKRRAEEELVMPQDAKQAEILREAEVLLPLPDEDSGEDAGRTEPLGRLAPESDVAWSPTPSPYGCCSPASSVPASPGLTLARPSPGGCMLTAPDLELELPAVQLLPRLAVDGKEVESAVLGLARQCSGDATTCDSGEREEFPDSDESSGDEFADAEDADADLPALAASSQKRGRPWAGWALWALGGLKANLHMARGGCEELAEAQFPAGQVHASAASAPLRPAVRTLEPSGKSGCNLHFSSSSEVCFFALDEGSAGPGELYERCIQTKVFDGPSGHKARRRKARQLEEQRQRRGFGLLSRLGFGASSMLDTAKIEVRREEVDEEDDESEEEDDWHYQCDEIAELMTKQRHTILWSASW